MGNNRFSFTDFLLLLVTMMWGVNTTVMKFGYKYLPAVPFNASRLFLAALFSWGVVYFTKSYRKTDKKDIPQILTICFFGFALLQVCISIGTSVTTAGNVSLILAMMPISVVIINRLLKIEEISLQSVIGIIFSFAGVLFIIIGSGKGFATSKSDLTGIIVILIAQFLFAYYTVFSKELLKKYSIYQVTAYAMTISFVFLFIFYFRSIVSVEWMSIPAAGWLSILYSALFGLCIGNILWSWCVKKVGSTRTAIYNNLPPVFTIITGYIMLGETLGLIQFLGALSIFIGLYVTKIKFENFKLRFCKKAQENE